ncbi:sister chromatid cohesion protein DCC1 isoform X1 [Cavia porcellus]|uniref:sister chromatid cohesion protein DCC1 isoform X1 n=1 Tax=Cavia porcellus TaxID=10141 RepID=UPI002FE01881
MSRTRAEVDATLQAAKLRASELLPTALSLRFGPGAQCCLLELEPALCRSLEAGHSLVIRGEKDEQAVLCSGDKTYELKVADTSNLLLCVPGCKTPEQLAREAEPPDLIHAEIFGFANNYWELRRCRPKLQKLRRLLMKNTYEGPDSPKEMDSNRTTYTTEDLLDVIQASKEEIMSHLQILNACEIGGYWRVLEFDYEMKLLNHVTQLVDSESWSFSKVPLSVCLQELGPLEPEEMIEHCLKCYGRKYVDEGEVYFELSADKICRATAQMLLQNAVKFNLAEFQAVWQQSVPEGMVTSLDQLKRPLWREADHRCLTHEILTVLRAKWCEGVQLPKTPVLEQQSAWGRGFAFLFPAPEGLFSSAHWYCAKKDRIKCFLLSDVRAAVSRNSFCI